MHPGLGDDAELALGRSVLVDLLQRAGRVAADDELGVHDEVDGAAERVERGLVTESTRNGMSSVTTWTMVCPLDQPSDSMLGFVTATLTVPTASKTNEPSGGRA